MNDTEKLTEHLKEIKGLGFVPSGNIKKGQDSKTNALFKAFLGVHNNATQTIAEIFFADGKPKISLRINGMEDLETLAKLSIEQEFEYAIREEKNDE